jgi:hypothetical protein
MSADRLLLGLIACLMLLEYARHERAKRQCRYCGGLNGHRQDCPYDFEQRGP